MKGDLLVTTTPSVENATVVKYLGVVSTNIVIGTNVFSDIIASFSDFFGGYSGRYKSKLELIYEKAREELIQKSINKGANCILNFNVDFDEISSQGKSMFMIASSGTAAIIEFEKGVKSIIPGVVDNEDLVNEANRRLLIYKINEKGILPSEDDWENIKHLSIPEIGKALLDKYIELDNDLDDFRKKEKDLMLNNLISYFLSIDSNIASSLLYPIVLEKGTKISSIIVKSNLFSAKHICELMDKGLNNCLLISLMSAERDNYTSDELLYMKKIQLKLNSFPDLHVRLSKKSLLGKEKEVIKCACGKSFDADKEYCPECKKNNKGFNKEEQDVIDLFYKKVEALESLLETNN
ncbi:YbjQ family protein [Parabacteroides sp. W1-Q-101]|uniref:YbjQ family protein n=1 Tax=Parabacteroides caeci TaxID=2949650 RepID=UPI00202F8D34|nr:YbjQ family protein [Parabacteroides sp. W1-Q-101]MCM0717373.1 YbjQ family protein [Parabacteroides sp. W1-Q-101]